MSPPTRSIVYSVLAVCVALCFVSEGLLAAPSLSLSKLLKPHDPTKATPIHRVAEVENTIEWSWEEDDDEGSLSLLIQAPANRRYGRSQLYTYPRHATVRDVLSSSLTHDLLHEDGGKHHDRCRMIDSAANTLPLDVSLGKLLHASRPKHGPTNAIRLQCMHATSSQLFTYSFVHFIAPHYAPNEIRAHHAIQRELSGEEKEYPMEGSELVATSWAGVWGWAESWIKYHWGPIPEYLSYENNPSGQTGRWHLNTGAILKGSTSFGPESDEEVRIGIVADWAAGTREADYVQQVMMNGNGVAYNPQWTIHVGDIYYLGAKEYIDAHCLGIAPEGVKKGVTWPHGSIGSIAVMGNHEMYSRAVDFFDHFLPTLGTVAATGRMSGQGAGYASLENKYWRILNLDTGFGTYSLLPKFDNRNNTQPQAIVDWLRNEVQIGNASDTRGIIILTHHQVQSAFESPYDATPKQIASMLPPNRTIIWLWGHEHRLAFYKMQAIEGANDNSTMYHGRCIGNSGFPSSLGPIPAKAQKAGLIAYDDRQYMIETGIYDLPVGWNGFARLSLKQRQAQIVYSSLASDPATGQLSPKMQTDLVEEIFEVDDNGNVQLRRMDILDKDMTVVDNQ